MSAIARHALARPHLELKTWTRFCPVCLSVTMVRVFFVSGKLFPADKDKTIPKVNIRGSLLLGKFFGVRLSILPTDQEV